MFIFAVIFYLVAAVVVAGILYVAVSGIVTLCRKIFTKNDVKLAIIATILIAIVLCIAISPAASRAEELSKLALRWAQENEFFVQLNKEERIIRGRIAVLTMWEANQEDLFDDEVIDVYFTELITY